MSPIAQNILQKLNQSNIKRKSGQITCNLAGINFVVDNRDILGGVIEEWFRHWLTNNGFKWSRPHNTQDWPDIILSNGDHLEVKAFDHNASPNFDIANLGAYVKSLQTNPERLNDDYIVFSYVFNNGVLWVEDYWIKKVWELSGPSAATYIPIGGNAINIRPRNWRSARVKIFQSRLDYVKAIADAAQQKLGVNSINWLNQVSIQFLQKTNSSL